MAGVETPLMESIINIASVFIQKDFGVTRKAFRQLGITGMRTEELLRYVQGLC